MAGRKKTSLEERVREGTFEARRPEHRELLLGDQVPQPAFAELQRRYKTAAFELEQRSIAREFEHAVREAYARTEAEGRTALRDLLEELGPHGSAQQVINFFPRFLVWDDGKQFDLDPFQQDFIRELYRRFPPEPGYPNGRRIYKEILLGMPRGNGKTPLASGLCLHSLAVSAGRAKILQAAGSKLQASIGTNYASNWVDDGELREWLKVGSQKVVRRDGRGTYTVVSSDGRLGHGDKPTASSIVDEWWLFRTAAEQQAYVAISSALHKELESYLLAISAAGYDKTSQLGEKYDGALKLPNIEHRREGFLRIARDEENGFLMWWHGMPEGYELDLEDDAAVLRALRLANPGSWVNTNELLRWLRRPGTDVFEWYRLALNFWTRTKGAWIAAAEWDALCDTDLDPPVGADIYVAVDAAHTYDSTAVAWAWIAPDGRPVVRSHVWSLRRETQADVYVDADELDNETLVEPFIHDLGECYRVREVVADPNYFGTELRHLGDRFLVSAVYPQSKEMTEYVQEFYRLVKGRLAHDGDKVLRSHVTAIAGEKNKDGYWKLGRLKQADPIDAGTASIMAVGRALGITPEEPAPPPSFTWLD